ncbi:heterokaryon incompatibility protein-domain-containing protein, partial [Lasiosphaeria hispida]
RLLTIAAGKYQDDIRVELHAAALSRVSPPAYEALSYVWGTQDNRGSVEIVPTAPEQLGSALAITHNLQVALRHFRLEDRPRCMWVDAICIDQCNLQERGGQVAIMGDIFELATRVVVWLGPQDDTSNEACELLAAASEEVTSSGQPCTVRPKPGSKITAEQLHRSNWSPFDGCQSEAVYALLSRPWFERVWIRQEIGLASPTTIIACGKKTIPWLQFKEALLFICVKGSSLPLSRQKSWDLYYRCRDVLLPVATSSSSTNFSDLRQYISMARCADDRDKLYGMLSLLHPSGQALGIVPDYCKSVRDVYLDATSRWITSQASLDILRSCEFSDTSSVLNLPTWVLDLSLPPSSTQLENHGAHLWGDVHRNPPISLQMGSETLGVFGIRGASVRNVHCILASEKPSVTSTNAVQMVNNIRSSLPQDFRTASYMNEKSLLEAYCATLGAGRLFHEEDSSPEMIQAFLGSQSLPGLYGEVQDIMRHVFCSDSSESPATNSDYRALWDVFSVTAVDRVLFTTNEGHVGLAPHATASGDQVYTVLGCVNPLIFRPLGGDRFRLIGECYCHGLMASESILGQFP